MTAQEGPPDTDAMALVAAILEAARPIADHETIYQLRMNLSVIQGTAERLAVLLEARDAAVESFLSVVDESVGIVGWHLNGATAEWGEFEWLDDLRPALKGAS